VRADRMAAGQTGCTGTRTKVHATIVIDHSYPGPRTDRVRIRSPLYIVHMLSISCAPAPPLRPGGLVRVKANAHLLSSRGAVLLACGLFWLLPEVR
jgi:hypothetical protein